MLTRTHRVLSIAIVEMGLISTNYYLENPLANGILILATGVGASLPDIDEYNSSVSRKSLINFSLLLRHRGITHSLLGWIIFSALAFLAMNFFMPIKVKIPKMPNYWTCLWLGLVIGYFLHLIEDSFSYQGVHWLAPFTHPNPFKKKHFRYRVGGLFEKLIAFLSIVGILVMTAFWLIKEFHINFS